MNIFYKILNLIKLCIFKTKIRFFGLSKKDKLKISYLFSNKIRENLIKEQFKRKIISPNFLP